MTRPFLKSILALFLAIQLAFPTWAAAQQQQPQPISPPVMVVGGLKLLVLEGEGAVNSIDKHQATPPVVEVRDENDKPVEGATVVFRLPPAGPGGSFPGQTLSRTSRTNLQGQAIASGLTPNAEEGRFKIHVTATAGNRIGESDIVQTNSPSIFATRPVPQRKLPHWWKWAALGVAAAATVGIVLVTTGGKSSTPPTTVTVTPGPVTIGGN
jgi:hypothetical protein